MKFFFSILTVLITSSAFAAQVKIFETRHEGDAVQVKFVVNESMNRAWVEVAQIGYGETNETTTHRVKVPGMNYDSVTESITLLHEGQIVECAQLVTRGRSVFRSRKVVNNRCTFSHKKVTLSQDDGFRLKKIKMLQVFLNIE